MKMNQTDKIFALKSIPLFATLNTFEIEALANQVEVLSFNKGDVVYEEKSSADQVYFIHHGKVKLACTSSCGKTLIKDIIHTKDVFGENVFQEQAQRSEYALALDTNTKLFKFRKQTIMDLVVRNQGFSDMLVQLIMTRMNNLEQRMQNFIFLKAKSRISEFIARMGAQRGVKIGLDEWLINHGLSHKEIAYMTDTSRQTVARVLGELKKDNFIHFSARKPSKILIRNIAALQAV